MLSKRDKIHQEKMPLSGLAVHWICRFFLPRFINTNPRDTVRFHLIRGRILFGLGHYEQAVSDFRSALQLDWRHEQAAFWLNKARVAIRHTEETRSLT